MPRNARELADFQKKLEFAIERNVTERALEGVRLSAQFTYETILDMWPTDTFWSKANHRINISGRRVADLRPRTRPSQSGALAGKAEAENQKELDKLDRLTTERRNPNVIIGNAVPYAPNVGGENGRGIRIYREAAAIGSRLAAAAFRR